MCYFITPEQQISGEFQWCVAYESIGRLAKSHDDDHVGGVITRESAIKSRKSWELV